MAALEPVRPWWNEESSIRGVRSLLEKYKDRGLREEHCKGQITDHDILYISRHLCEMWRDLSPLLSMPKPTVNDIDRGYSGETERKKTFFSWWKKAVGSGATYLRLIGALLEVGCQEDAEKVCERVVSHIDLHQKTDCPSNATVTTAATAYSSKVIKCLQYQLNRYRNQVMHQYASYVSRLCERVEQNGVTVQSLTTFLLNLPALKYGHDQYQHTKLLANKRAQVKGAKTIHEVFDVVGEECASFLNYRIFESIADRFDVSSAERKDLNYSVHLKEYLNKHKVSELIKVVQEMGPLMKEDDATKMKITFKLDIELTREITEIFDLKDAIADALDLNPLALELTDIKADCVMVTFLIPVTAVEAVFDEEDKAMTSSQLDLLKALPIIWIEYEGHKYNLKATAAQLAQIHEALTDVKKRDEFKLCAKKKCVPLNTLSGTMSGFTGSGKTHTLAMLTNQPPPILRVSTSLNQVPTRTITRTLIGVDVKGNFEKMTDEQYSKRVMVTAKASVAPIVSGVPFKLKTSLHKIFSRKSSEPTDPVERELLLNLHMADDMVQSLEGHTIVEISDCGGQPQFTEILPKFIEFIDFSIIVFDLSLCFSDYPINCFFNRKGKSVGKGVPYSLTNEQVVRLSLQMIVSRSQAGDRQVKFAFVGTHRDLEGECSEPREVKNQRLREMVEAFGLQDSVIVKSRSEYIFAINAKTPEAVDHQTIGQLRGSILDQCPPHSISIPVSYHALELTVKRKAAETGHIAFDMSAMLKELSSYNFTKSSLQEGLQYLHENKRIFYYPKDFPGRFIGEPQAILNKQTELVVYNIQLSTNPDMLPQLDREQWRFVKYGFLTISCLNKFPDHYVEGVFTPVDMLKLFVKLLMISEVGRGEYLMPCVLPTDPLADCNPEPDTQSVPSMALHFPGGPARHGIFCGTICHLMTESKWELEMDPYTIDGPFHITRNSAHFTLPGHSAKVTINDPFDSFFVVTVHVPGDVPAYSETVGTLCIKVRDTLIEAIGEVTENLNYSPGTPSVAFLCSAEHEKGSSLHPAEVSKIGDKLLCTRDKTRKAPLTPGHRVWLRDLSSKEPFPDLNPPQSVGPPSLSARPELHQLLMLKGSEGKYKRIIVEVAAHWEHLAMLLDFEDCVIYMIKEDNRRRDGMIIRCCRDMLCRWLDGEAGWPVTWGKLVQAIRDLPNGKLATEIEQLLQH